MVKLKNRIELLKMQEDDDNGDVPSDSTTAARQGVGAGSGTIGGGSRLSRAARSAIFKEVVLAKVRDMKEQEARENAERTATSKLSQQRR